MELNRLAFAYGLYLPATYVRGEPITRYLHKLLETQWAPLQQLEAIQQRKLRALVDAARTGTSFYGERISSGTPALDSLPFLQKADIQNSSAALMNRNASGAFTTKTTGGSTGQAVTIRKSRDAAAQETAASWRGYGWAGIRIGDKQGRF